MCVGVSGKQSHVPPPSEDLDTGEAVVIPSSVEERDTESSTFFRTTPSSYGCCEGAFAHNEDQVSEDSSE